MPELALPTAPAASVEAERASVPSALHQLGWSARRRATLTALVARMLEGAPLAESRVEAVAREVERRIAGLAAHQQHELGRALDLFDSRLVGLLTIGRPVSFAAAHAVAQGRWLTGWAVSPVPALRSALQAFRRLALAVHYSDPAVTAAIGHAGPLHTRVPEVTWEGPLSADSSAPLDGPVAIGATDLRPTIRPAAPPIGVRRGVEASRDEHRTADVVVIGTGAGGAVAAERLARAGFEVVILEDGGLYQAADFTEQEAPLAEQLYADAAMRATDDLAVQLLQGRAVGGSTTINWMIMLRTPEFVLDEWQRVHGLSGFDAATLAPVFERVEREVHARRVSEDAHSPNNRVVLEGARALGWRASTAVINAKGCVRSGFCGIGCRYDAKQGTLLTYVPRALAAGATLYADTHADRLEVLERDRGNGTAPRKRVHATVRHGARTYALTIDAPLVVVAAGAVGSPVLLQRSGLGGGAVGQYLRLHPTTATLGLFDQEIVGSAGIPLSTMCDEHLRWKDSDYGFWLECPPFLPALGAVAVPGFGTAHASRMMQFRHLSSVIALTRDGADTRTSSGRVDTSRDGRVSIRYALTAPDAERVRASIEAAARLQLAAGAREVHTLHTEPIIVRRATEAAQIRQAPVGPNQVGLFSAHVNGTCRMGNDPRTAATSPDGERFGARGVYVCDGSLLPTALGVNPQHTIMALATLVSERLAARYGRTVPLHGEPA